MMGPGELSELTGIKPRTITRLAQESKIPAVKVGRQWRFIRDEVENWLRSRASNTPRRILIVDDDEELVELMRLVITNLGHEVVTACGGTGALEILERDSRFSLLVLDLQMPGISGPDVIEWMHARGLSIQTLIITAHPESDLMARALSHGHFTVLKKPFDPENLRRVVDGLINGVSMEIAV
jgi:excisionase family DNA binding protein